MFESEGLYELWKDESLLNRFLDFIGFTDIYLSPLTIVILGIFFINLLVVMLNRIPAILRRAYFIEEMPSFSAVEMKKGKDIKSISPVIEYDKIDEQLRWFFRKKRWFFKQAKKGNTFIAVKNRLSPVGFLLFHLSFFFCLFGGLMITYTRFSGKLPLTEGQSFQGDIKQFRTIDRDPIIFKELPSLWLYLEKVEPFYENDVPTELVATLLVKYWDDEKKEVLKVNEPIKRGSVSVIVEKIGVSPLFVVRGPSDRELDAAYVSLNVLEGQQDSFQFETDRNVTFHVKFYPDYFKEDGIEKTKSIELKNPALHLSILKNGKMIYDGTIRKGEYAPMGMVKIGFEDIRYWAEFLIVREYGKFSLIAGFIIAAVGLIMRLVFYQKQLRLAIDYEKDKPLVYISGRSEYFQHSFKEEFNGIVNELDKFLEK
jgi:cytochrome c biogenesis protein ResB